MRNKTNRENTRQRKQSHAQDNIYVVRQFTYVHVVAGISLLSGKNTEYNLQLQYFLSNKNTTTTCKLELTSLIQIPLPSLLDVTFEKKKKDEGVSSLPRYQPAKFFLDEIGQGVDANWVQNIELMENYIWHTWLIEL